MSGLIALRFFYFIWFSRYSKDRSNKLAQHFSKSEIYFSIIYWVWGSSLRKSIKFEKSQNRGNKRLLSSKMSGKILPWIFVFCWIARKSAEISHFRIFLRMFQKWWKKLNYRNFHYYSAFPGFEIPFLLNFFFNFSYIFCTIIKFSDQPSQYIILATLLSHTFFLGLNLRNKFEAEEWSTRINFDHFVDSKQICTIQLMQTIHMLRDISESWPSFSEKWYVIIEWFRQYVSVCSKMSLILNSSARSVFCFGINISSLFAIEKVLELLTLWKCSKSALLHPFIAQVGSPFVVAFEFEWNFSFRTIWPTWWKCSFFPLLWKFGDYLDKRNEWEKGEWKSVSWVFFHLYQSKQKRFTVCINEHGFSVSDVESAVSVLYREE